MDGEQHVGGRPSRDSFFMTEKPVAWVNSKPGLFLFAVSPCASMHGGFPVCTLPLPP